MDDMFKEFPKKKTKKILHTELQRWEKTRDILDLT